MSTVTRPLMVYLPDTRGVRVSHYGKGNLKIGPNTFTYSRMPGRVHERAIGSEDALVSSTGTCPGATDECLAICYARRVVQENGAVAEMWLNNSITDEVPEIPADARLLRIHIGGDFDCVEYINNWVQRLQERPDVTAWVYTRSWRVPALLEALEGLRALDNVQCFASMDLSTVEMPPEGWRIAWIDGDPRAGKAHRIFAHTPEAESMKAWDLQLTEAGTKALICPEETKAVDSCEQCGFCFHGVRNDVVFLRH